MPSQPGQPGVTTRSIGQITRYALMPLVLVTIAAGTLFVDTPRPARAACLYTVTNTADGGVGSLRDAINTLNTAVCSGGTIDFNIPAPPYVIAPASPLPTPQFQTIIDGSSQPGYVAGGAPVIQIDGAGAGIADGIGFQSTAGGSKVIALTIRRFAAAAILVNLTPGVTITSSYLGTDATGTVAMPNGGGIDVLSANGTTIGGAAAGEGNLISGNTSDGIIVSGNSSVTNIFNNRIGTDVTGTAALGNGHDGIFVRGPLETFIGQAGAGNVISGNTVNGIEFDNVTSPNFVKANLIGLNAAGSAALPNGNDGVRIAASTAASPANSQQVGDTVTAPAPASNVISGNSGFGVEINGQSGSAQNNAVVGNLVGTDAGGGLAIPNGAGGVAVVGAAGNFIGVNAGGAPGPNVISGNSVAGVVFDAAAQNTLVVGNFIGTAGDHISPLGNAGDGVVVRTNSAVNAIGKAGGGAATNTIAFNAGTGVRVLSGVSDGIRANSIHDNADGIVIAPGANNQPPEAPPVVDGASITTVKGHLDSLPNTNFTFEVFASPVCGPGNGEGTTYLTSVTVPTNGLGHAVFFALYPAQAPGTIITVTATDPANNSSQFSNCAVAASQQCPNDSDCDGYGDAQELSMGKDPLTYCAIMRADVDNNGIVNILDLSAVANHYHQSVPPAPQRDDQGPPPFDNMINILDLSKMAAQYNKMVSACP